jgi:NAD(P)-dependent dehydrogenase (short-subunit alcohol dehydrogenase family)
MADPGSALVTGAAAGLGLAICRQLAAAGWRIIAVDRDRDGLAEIRRTLGERVECVVCDLADLSAVEALQAELARLGLFRLAVFCAGINATGNFAAIPIERQTAVITVNLTAPIAITGFLTGRGAVEPGGRLIFVSSLSRYLGYPGAAAYAASKDGLAVFARSLRKPLARSGIGVLTVCPGPLDTAHAARHAPPGADRTRRMDPDAAAREILAATRRPALAGLYLGGNVCVPGILPKILAVAGMLLPGIATRVMRRIIFERL